MLSSILFLTQAGRPEVMSLEVKISDSLIVVRNEQEYWV